MFGPNLGERGGGTAFFLTLSPLSGLKHLAYRGKYVESTQTPQCSFCYLNSHQFLYFNLTTLKARLRFRIRYIRFIFVLA